MSAAPAPLRPRVLVIDDEPITCRAVARLLRDDYDVATALDGTAALALLHAGQRFGVILCDVSMPNMGGLEFLDCVVELSPAQARRIAFIAANSWSGAADELRRRSHFVVEKPFDAGELKQLVARLAAE